MHIKESTRPWGNFRQFTENEPTTVKIIRVTKGNQLSLQYHLKRDEFWLVLSGNPLLTINEKPVQATPNDEYFITKTTNHRIAAPTDDVAILEIAFGDFDEDDIVRIEDAYGRVS